MDCSTYESVVVDSPTMLVQVENLPCYDGAENEVERDRDLIEEEEVLERDDLLRDDGEEVEELEQEVVISLVLLFLIIDEQIFEKKLISFDRRWREGDEELRLIGRSGRHLSREKTSRPLRSLPC